MCSILLYTINSELCVGYFFDQQWLLDVHVHVVSLPDVYHVRDIVCLVCWCWLLMNNANFVLNQICCMYMCIVYGAYGQEILHH